MADLGLLLWTVELEIGYLTVVDLGRTNSFVDNYPSLLVEDSLRLVCWERSCVLRFGLPTTRMNSFCGLSV